jgi:hypothetical protein
MHVTSEDPPRQAGTERGARTTPPAAAGAPRSRDVVLGLAAGAARAGLDAGHVALAPARAALRAPVLGDSLRRIAADLAHQGSLVRARGLAHLELAANELLAAPELERAVDRALASPAVDRVVDHLVERRLAERRRAGIAPTAGTQGRS